MSRTQARLELISAVLTIVASDAHMATRSPEANDDAEAEYNDERLARAATMYVRELAS
jgi:hypothetical protein